MITVPQLKSIGLSPRLSDRFAVPLSAACDRFEINSKERRAAFLGQCIVESSSFSKLVESLFYRTPSRARQMFSIFKSDADAIPFMGNEEKLGNHVYAGRGGNGDEASGDGFRFRGRGPIQTTFHDNYLLAERDCGQPYVEHPELLETPEDGCLASAAFFKRNGLNTLADKGDIDGITRRVNGPKMDQKELRRIVSAKALKVLTNS